jgi:hypothetical protein
MKPVLTCVFLIISFFSSFSLASVFTGTCKRIIVGYSYDAAVPSRFELGSRTEQSLTGNLVIGEFQLNTEFQGLPKFFGGSPDEYVSHYQVPNGEDWPDGQDFSIDFKSDSEIKVKFRRANYKSIFTDIKVWGDCTLHAEMTQ